MNTRPRRQALKRAAGILGITLAAAAAPGVQAKDLPLWELGLGVAGLWFPDYRGADETRGYVLPVPYVVYRGEFFKADRNGIRGMPPKGTCMACSDEEIKLAVQHMVAGSQ